MELSKALELGLHPTAYWAMSVDEANMLYIAHERLTTRHKDMLQMLRLLLTMVHNVNAPRAQQKRPEQLLKLSFDRPERGEVITPQQLLNEAREWQNRK